MRTSDIAVIGERDAVLCFKAVGVEVLPAADPAEAGARLRETIEGGFKVIFLTESLAGGLEAQIGEIALRRQPSLVLIPGARGEPQLGRAHVREVVRKAVGADVFLDESENR